MPASFNLGVWRLWVVSRGTLYRWVGDQGESGAGFVVLDADADTLRPADSDGRPIGDLTVDCRTGAVSGTADGIDRGALMQVAAAMVRARARSGADPETAHAYFG